MILKERCEGQRECYKQGDGYETLWVHMSSIVSGAQEVLRG